MVIQDTRHRGRAPHEGEPASEVKAEQGIKGWAERIPSETGRQSDEAAQPQHVER